MKLLHIVWKYKKFYLVLLVLAFCTTFFPLKVFAAENYGDGSYGAGNYNVGATSTPTPTTSSVVSAVANIFSPASAPVCGMTQPANSPQWLYAAIPQDGTSVILYFTDASGTYDHYVVEYGLSAGDYIFGLDNAGGKGTRTVAINNLMPNTTYYFRVRPGNGCAPGAWSNEISTKTQPIVTTNSLAFTSTQVIPVRDTQQGSMQGQVKGSCRTYTVKSGDTLYAVAQNLLGDGNKYQQLIDQNKTVYPSLASSHSLSVGWKLQVSCQNAHIDQKQPISLQGTSGYDVNVIVKDMKNQPISGATVTMHSAIRTGKTDKTGVVTFHNMDKGQHQVLIAYGDYQGQENINLEGNVKAFAITVQVKPVGMLISPFVYVITGVLVVIILLLLFFLLRKRKSSI